MVTARRPTRQGLTSSGTAIDAGVARDLSELARALQAEADTGALLRRIVDAAVFEVPGADHAAVSLITKHRVETEACTSEVAKAADAAQYRLGDGPCLQSLRNEITVRSDDLRSEQRWPRFAAAAVDLGLRSNLSLQLFVEGDNLGALNLYAEKEDAFTAADENVGLLLATHAAVALVAARKVSNLQTALDSRDVIGQAKGILMERFKINATQAFGMLVAVSQHHHRKLNVIAEQLANTGELPDITT